MTSLQTRSAEIEIMDDLNCNGEVVDQTLRELEIINRLLGGDHVTIDGIRKLVKKGGKYSIADCGCGGGDLAMKIFEWGKKNGFKFNVEGVDANPYIINIAESNFKELSFFSMNVFSKEFQQKQFDIITATLFVHHFTNDELVALFKSWKAQARVGVVINDIHRHFLSYHSIRLLTSLFSRSDMVKFDAPLSVRRAFTKKELVDILERAGIKTYSLKWKWAFRWQIVIFS